MLGDDPEDHMAKSAVKLLLKKGINVLTMSPGKKNYSHHNSHVPARRSRGPVPPLRRSVRAPASPFPSPPSCTPCGAAFSKPAPHHIFQKFHLQLQ